MEEITGFDEQVSGWFDFLKGPKIKLPTVTVRPSLSNTNLVLTPDEKALILARRAKNKGGMASFLAKSMAKAKAMQAKKRNLYGYRY
jgi:hypothetical protein